MGMGELIALEPDAEVGRLLYRRLVKALNCLCTGRRAGPLSSQGRYRTVFLSYFSGNVRD